MDPDDRDVVLACELAQRSNKIVVAVVELCIPVLLLRWPYHLENVNHDEPRIFGLFDPFAQILEPALVKPAPACDDGEPLGPLLAIRQELRQASPQTPLALLKREIKHVSLFGFHVTEHVAIARSAQADVLHEPSFAYLRFGDQQVKAFGGDQAWKNVFQHGKA